MTDEIDDAMSEAAAFRHAPTDRKANKHPKYVPSADEITLHIRLDRKTFSELMDISKRTTAVLKDTRGGRSKSASRISGGPMPSTF
jgi:hypothetical protein